MGVLSGIKKALSAVGRWDRRQVYGDDYEEKMAALGRMSGLREDALRFENQSKFEEIQRMRDEFEQQNVEGAIELEGSLPVTPDPSFVGPRLDEAGLPNPTGEGTLENNTASELFKVPEKYRGIVRAAGGEKRASRENRERDDALRRNTMLASQESLIDYRRALEEKARRPPAAGRGERDKYPPLQYRNGKPGYYDRVTGVFTELPEGAVPGNVNLPQGLGQELAGIDGAQQHLGTLRDSLEKARGRFGPGIGQLKWAQGNFVGGAGLDKAELNALNDMTRATYNAAFEQGGKTLTDNELRAFTAQMPQAGDTFESAVVKIENAIQWLETRRAARRGTMSPGQAQVYDAGRSQNAPAKKESAREKAKRLKLLP